MRRRLPSKSMAHWFRLHVANVAMRRPIWHSLRSIRCCQRKWGMFLLPELCWSMLEDSGAAAGPPNYLACRLCARLSYAAVCDASLQSLLLFGAWYRGSAGGRQRQLPKLQVIAQYYV